MKWRKTEHGFIARLETGEKIMEGLVGFCIENHIASGIVLALGAVKDPELGYYHLKDKEYSWKKFEGMFEVLGAVGNVTLVDEQPLIHLHMTIGDQEFRAYGGHFKEGEAGATCEVTIMTHAEPLLRELDEKVGLKLWKL